MDDRAGVAQVAEHMLDQTSPRISVLCVSHELAVLNHASLAFDVNRILQWHDLERPRVQHDRQWCANGLEVEVENGIAQLTDPVDALPKHNALARGPVSYTHLTLPT